MSVPASERMWFARERKTIRWSYGRTVGDCDQWFTGGETDGVRHGVDDRNTPAASAYVLCRNCRGRCIYLRDFDGVRSGVAAFAFTEQ